MSRDYLKAFLAKRNIYYEDIDPPKGIRRWKWLIRFANFEVYMLNSCRFLLIEKDSNGYMADFSLHVNSKCELVKRLEEKL